MTNNSKRGRMILCIILLLTASCSPTGPDASSPEAEYLDGSVNVLLISLDTLRADHLSLYGYQRPTSPNLEELAQDAVVFEQFINNGGFTLRSHMSLMTSMRPEVHGVHESLQNSLPEARTTLAEVLRDQGFKTAAFVDAGWMRAKFGFDQGFDLYDDEGGRFAKILPKAKRWLREHHGERFFLFVHTFDIHSQWGRRPYDCPGDYPQRYETAAGAFDGCKVGRCGTHMLRFVSEELSDGRNPLSLQDVKQMKAWYDGCINYVDDKVGEILRELRELGVYDRTLVIVLSDHGEEFLEHGQVLHMEPSFYEELIHIPLIVKLPESLHGGARVPQLAAMIDVLPTLLDVLDLEIPGEAQGTSLMPSVMERRAVRSGARNQHALRTLRWKYDPKQGLLYDLVTDPMESENLWRHRLQLGESLVGALHQQLRRMVVEDRRLRRRLVESTPDANPEVTLSDEHIRELRALGYL